MSQLKKLIHEIHRRSLWQVLGIYIVASWVVLQVVDVVGNNFGMPEWVPPAALILLLIGLPIVLATAFVQDGIPRKTAEPRAPASGETAPGSSLVDAGETTASSVPEPAAYHRVLTWRNALLGGVAAFALLGVLTAGYLFMRSAGIGPAGTLVAAGVLDERDAILIASLASVSGDPTLARTATEALRADIAESPTVTVLGSDRIAQALELIRADPDTPLDLDLARQIAAREGVKAVIAGEVNAAGSGYVFTAQVVSVEAGEVLASRRESAGDETEVIDAIDRLSKGIRERLGESLKSVQSSPPLAQVTTNSLEALRLYQEGTNAIDTGDRDRGRALLEQAVAIDSAFASAWRKLATDLNNPGAPPDGRSRAVEAATRAYRHLDRLTPYEQVRAETMYYTIVTGDPAREIAAYERALERWPDNVAFLNNLSVRYIARERLDRAEELLRRAWELDSVTTFHHTNLYRTVVKQGRLEAADSLVEETQTRHFDFAPFVVVGLAATRSDWAEVDRLVDSLDVGQFTPWTVATVRGRLAEGEALLARRMDERDRERRGAGYVDDALRLAFVDARLREDAALGLQRVEAALGRYPLDGMDPLNRPYPALAELYAMAGRPDRARELLDRWEAEVRTRLGRVYDSSLHRALSEVALAEGRPDEAIAEQRRAEVSPCRTSCPDLARVYDLAGRVDSALAVYTRYSESHAPFVGSQGGAFNRAPALERLGQLYDAEGDLENAAKYYAMFVELWAEADEELQPRVRAAQARLEEILAERG